jgi:membrane protease YdiL (CAAX protease family)
MIMVGVGTYISGKYVFRDGFAHIGWRFGRSRYYVYAFALALFLWLLPTVLEHMLGFQSASKGGTINSLLISFVVSFAVTLIPAFGEEFTWRGYLLPRLLARYNTRHALLLHGFITWVWHLPFIVAMGIAMGGNVMLSVLIIAGVSLIPTVMNAIVFAFFWSASASIAVPTIYHAAFDEVRDTLQDSIGFGLFAEVWQMVTLTTLGLFMLMRHRWKVPA